MALLSLQQLSIAFGGPLLLDSVTLQIEKGERLCLVGRNGEGKSTLLKIIAGELKPDSGEIIRQRDIRTAALDQEVPETLTGTVFDVVSSGLGDVVGALFEYRRALHLIGENNSESAMQELANLQHQIETSGGWQIHQQVETILSRLALNPDDDAAGLSGGYKRRVLLARALVNAPDILLLDEPTNHLDIETIAWLEEFLAGFRGAIVFITHDRRFLKALATRIVELDRGRITDWPGNYDLYLARRQAELNAEATRETLFDKKLAREEDWIRQGIKARRTRNEGRVRALKKLREERARRRTQAGAVSMKLNMAERSGRLVIEAGHIDHRAGGRQVIRDFSTTVMREDRIGIIGPNGSGKTTLLRILLGLTEPDSGSVRLGTGLEIAYFDQHRAELDREKSVIDNVGGGSMTVTVNSKTRHIVGYLEDFLFSPERARLPVKVLSGGERNRALLAKLFTQPSNLLVMDEPTNDLDAETLELLEEMLLDYRGTILLVSHDRAFLDNIVTSTIAFEGGGKLSEYVGGYEDYLRQRSVPAAGEAVQGKQREKPAERNPDRDRPRMLTFREKKELDELPGLIETMESELAALYATLSDPEFYRQEKTGLLPLSARIAELEKNIPSAYERWAALEALPRGRQ